MFGTGACNVPLYRNVAGLTRWYSGATLSMKRTFSLLFSIAMMMAFVLPAAAQDDSTPEVSTPTASPSAVALQPGVTEYSRTDVDDEEEDLLSIDLTAFDEDDDGIAIMDSFDPEVNAGEDYVFVEEYDDAPDDCRIIEYTAEGDVDIYIGICADDEFGLWVVGTEQDAVEHVAEQFSEGETDLVPDDYEEVETD